jgi:hypothetical protein
MSRPHVIIVHTPTGSGKSLIATAVHFKALAERGNVPELLADESRIWIFWRPLVRRVRRRRASPFHALGLHEDEVGAEEVRERASARMVARSTSSACVS